MKVKNKVIVVTGGGNGIGRELVLNLISRGAYVAAVDINETALQETDRLAEGQRERLSTHIVDVTDRDAMSALPKQVIAEHDAVDGTVSGVTSANGTVTLHTNWKRNPKGTWCFKVVDVAKDGYTYNSSANVVTLACE